MPTTDILRKFDIPALNPMQLDAARAIAAGTDVVLLSPTGTGKTLAFLLPLVEALNPDEPEVQALILVPTRELAQQIEQVARKMGSGYKVNAVYGGRSGTLDKRDLKHRPAILIGTPGRLADRFRRDNLDLRQIKTVVLDEFDKSLEIGFEKEMEQIVGDLPGLRQRILTSATADVAIPGFLGLHGADVVDYLGRDRPRLTVKTVVSADKDKLEALRKALAYIGPQPGIVFCNFKDGLERVSDFLGENGVAHECFHGSMEQIDRDRALVKFRNGTSRLLLATDLAARGIDVPDLAFVLHYHLPPREREFTHRNGRTARMHADGVAYVLQSEQETLPDYLSEVFSEHLDADGLPPATAAAPPAFATAYISGGRRDKISKGDVAGFLMKQGQLKKDELGVIELQQTCAYAGVLASVAGRLVASTDNQKLKTKKVRVSLL